MFWGFFLKKMFLTKRITEQIRFIFLEILDKLNTIKVLNFRMQENLAVINIKFIQRRQTLGYFTKKMEKAKSEDPDQTAPLGAV